jgi:hypothetical protein
MTIDELRIQAQLISSLQIDPSTAYKWATDELLNIAAEYFRAGEYTKEPFQTTESFEDYTPARDLLTIDKIIDKSSGRRCTDYEIHGEVLTISVPGKYELRYYSYPDLPMTATEQIKMPRQYVVPIKFYLAARIRARLFGQNDSNAVSFMSEYTERMKKADITTDTQRNRHNRMPPGRRDL